jgi:hypothetical protein
MSEAEASRRDPIARALATAARVSREGGIGHVTLPSPDTGHMTTFEIDQTHARKILASFLDSLASDLWRLVRESQPLQQRDREFLRVWTAVTIAENEYAEFEHRAESGKRRSRLYVVRRGSDPH